ncbi:MAG: heme biosynthesis HemY N-terminal domain-containing protein [Hyphomicrobiales bacterium]
MLRVIFFLALVLAFAFGFAWLADRPGTVAIDWMGYQIELSAMLAMVALLVLIVVLMAAWWVLKVIIRSPQIMGGYFSARRRDKGYEALSSGLIAAGSGDSRSAQRYAQQARKLAPDAPLTHVLSASSADLSGDAEAKRRAYRQMLDDPKTQLLGLRGLYVDAVAADDEEAARHFASQAAALAPALPWAGQAQFEDQVQRGDWPAARSALERNLQSRIVTKAERNRLRAVLLTAEALDREEGEPEEARPLAQEAHKLAPELVPAAAVAGRLLIRAGKMTQASKAIESTWRKVQHPELAEVYLYVRPGDAVADRVKRARKLVQLCAHQLEGELALARALMEAGKLDEARETLDPHTGPEATQRVCLLMAEIEEKQGGDTAAVRGWMARALRAKRDPAWVADGYISSTWEPVSPLSGRVDAFEWKVPVERFSGHDPVAIPDDAMSDDGQVMLPARLPGVAAAIATGADTAHADADAQDVEDADLVVEASPPVEVAEDKPSEPMVTEETEKAPPAPVGQPDMTVVEDKASDKDQSDRADAVGSDRTPKSDASAEPVTVIAAPVVANDDGPMDASAKAEADEKPEDEPGSSDTAKSATVTPLPIAADDPEAEEKGDYSGLPGGHAPDDPGPEGNDDENGSQTSGERRRFRLF